MKTSLKFRWIDSRYKYLSWINRYVCKTPEGQIPPKWLRICAVILFPFYSYYSNQSHIRFDPICGKYTIEGQEFSFQFFKYIASAEDGLVVKIRKSLDGVTSMEIVK